MTTSEITLRALLVEDSEDDAILLIAQLEEGGVRVEWTQVETGEALNTALDRGRWDIIFCDFSMPHFSGTKALAMIRERDPDIPFIFVSGTIGEEKAVEAMRSGAQDYVMKGNLTRLVPAVMRELAEARMRRERREADAMVRKLSRVVDQAADNVFITDPEGNIEYVNPAFEQLTGYTSVEVIGRPASVLKSGQHEQAFYERLWKTIRSGQVFRGTLINRTKGGEFVYEQKVIAPLMDDDGRITHFVSTGRDITEHKRIEAELQHWATHDVLTGLPNRILLGDRLDAELRRAHENGVFAAVLSLDIDNFKRINSSLGHQAGDALLKAVGNRLREVLPSGCTLARHGGDEFAVVAGNLATVDHVLHVLNRLRSAFESAVHVNGQDVFVSFNTGIAVFPEDGDDWETLIRNADSAMHRAKRRRAGDYQFYTSEMNARGQELLVLEAELRHALERREFVVYYQPQMDLRTGRIVSVEALLRWMNPTRGLVSPADFVPLLEETGMIVPVGEWVLRQACADWRTCNREGHVPLRMAVNVSAHQFSDSRLVDTVRRMLVEESLPPCAIELEITEQTVMDDVQAAGETLEALHALGVRLAVDDFGTGYSSLAYLKRFPLDALKIDRGFVCDVTHDANDAAIVEASISLAHKLGLEVVAEGVEKQEQLVFLRDRQCDLVQGYYFGRPCPIDDVVASFRGGSS